MTSAPATTNSAKKNPSQPLLERLGVRYFRNLSASLPNVETQDEIYVLNADERKTLAGLVRGAVFRASLAGAFSAALAAGAEVFATKILHPKHAQNVETTAEFWAIVVGVTVIAAILEILFLYWDSLRTVHRMARAAGYDPFGNEASDDQSAVAAALARAALELPNPKESPFGVDPHREASKIRLLLASLLYKVKVSITNFAVKVLVRRIAGRALARRWLPFVAVPGTAAWNGIVCYIVLREARIRVMGPSAAHELIRAIFDQGITLSAEGRVMLARAVASSIVRTEDLHPNLHAVLVEVAKRIEDPLPDDIDDSRKFVEEIGRLEKQEQRMALQTLAAAAIIDGRFSGTEKKLVREALIACGKSPDVHPVEQLRKAFIRGDGSLDTFVRSLFG